FESILLEDDADDDDARWAALPAKWQAFRAEEIHPFYLTLRPTKRHLEMVWIEPFDWRAIRREWDGPNLEGWLFDNDKVTRVKVLHSAQWGTKSGRGIRVYFKDDYDTI